MLLLVGLLLLLVGLLLLLVGLLHAFSLPHVRAANPQCFIMKNTPHHWYSRFLPSRFTLTEYLVSYHGSYVAAKLCPKDNWTAQWTAP